MVNLSIQYKVQEQLVKDEMDIQKEIRSNVGIIDSSKVKYRGEWERSNLMMKEGLPSKIEIIRKLVDNTFAIKMQYDQNAYYTYEKELNSDAIYYRNWPLIQVNNKKVFEIHSEDNYKKTIIKSHGNIFIPPELIKRQTMDKTNSIVIGFTKYSNTKAQNIIKLKIINHLRDDVFNIKPNQAIHFKITNKLELKLAPTKVNYLKNKKAEYKFLQYNVIQKYTHILLLPIKIKKQGLIKNLYKVAMWNDDGDLKNLSNDFKLQANKIENLITGSLTKKMIAKYRKVSSNETINNHKICGVISFNDVSYYDYSKEKTFLSSFNLKPNYGYILPYSFNGYFNPKLNVSLNNLYKNIKINSSYYFENQSLINNRYIKKISIKKNDEKFIADEIFLIKSEDFNNAMEENLNIEDFRLRYAFNI